MNALLMRADKLELGLCLRINWLSNFLPVVTVFKVVSRLGDGVIWYTLLAVFAFATGWQGVGAMLHVGLTSVVGVAIYSYLKNRLVRPRPFVSHGRIVCRIAPLDQYSFPSGHTLHAVLFTTMFAMYLPATLIWLAPFAVLVALSRIVLGLHYPSDVLVGAAIGYSLALISASLFPVEPLSFVDSINSWRSLW